MKPTEVEPEDVAVSGDKHAFFHRNVLRPEICQNGGLGIKATLREPMGDGLPIWITGAQLLCAPLDPCPMVVRLGPIARVDGVRHRLHSRFAEKRPSP